MEPLSIAGSIVGLIVATIRISSLLTPIISEARDAPKNIIEIKAEADNLRATLEQLQLLLLGRSQLLHSRTSLIRVDQVVLTLTACVSNSSDLELLLRPLRSDGSIGVLDRIGWVHNSKIVKEHVSKLQMHKSSLALILNILTCESTMNAEATVANLVAVVERLVESNEMIVNRILSGQVESETVREREILRETETIRETPLEGSITETSHDLTPAATAHAIYFGFDFDDQLESSRAYQRATRNDDNFSISVISSADRTASWSILSGISLSQVSSIAAVRLPIYKHEISNSEDYGFEIPTSIEFVLARPHLASPLWADPRVPRVAENAHMSIHQRFIRTVVKRDSNNLVAGEWLEFEQGEIFFVHSYIKHAAIAISLRSRCEGILWNYFYEVYEPEFLQKLMTAVASLVEALEGPLFMQTFPPGNLQPINEIVAGVRYLFESTSCLTRDTEILSRYADLRNIRKGLLSALSELVNSSRQIQSSMFVIGAADELEGRAFKLMRKAVLFHDTIVGICTTPDHQASVAQRSQFPKIFSDKTPSSLGA